MFAILRLKVLFPSVIISISIYSSDEFIHLPHRITIIRPLEPHYHFLWFGLRSLLYHGDILGLCVLSSCWLPTGGSPPLYPSLRLDHGLCLLHLLGIDGLHLLSWYKSLVAGSGMVMLAEESSIKLYVGFGARYS